MCLTLTDITPRVAEEDITVYKVLFSMVRVRDHISNMMLKKSLREATYMSPYQYAPYELGKRYESVLGKPNVRYDDEGELIDINLEEGLHTYGNLEDAVSYRNATARHWGTVVVKCRIPKGAEYYEGLFPSLRQGDVLSYASDTLVLDEVVGD